MVVAAAAETGNKAGEANGNQGGEEEKLPYWEILGLVDIEAERERERERESHEAEYERNFMTISADKFAKKLTTKYAVYVGAELAKQHYSGPLNSGSVAADAQKHTRHLIAKDSQTKILPPPPSLSPKNVRK